ncbi:hypothetical protein [Pseudoduganella danionis]|uniref:hypothetical protein n=1 Tax=Pseudoduganella danionis TaxID=1890295 RepID=UPI0035B1FCED
MDSFVRLFALYSEITRWSIIRQIYRRADIWWKLCLWIPKLVFAMSSIATFLLQAWWVYFLGLLLSATMWGWAFENARRLVFAEQSHLYPERLRYFANNYQYIRYLQFREVLQENYAGCVKDALVFLDQLFDTSVTTPIAAHPLLTLLFGAAIALFSGVVTHWPVGIIVMVQLSIGVCIYVSYMVLGVIQTHQANLKEFKRFLIWAANEPMAI